MLLWSERNWTRLCSAYDSRNFPSYECFNLCVSSNVFVECNRNFCANRPKCIISGYQFAVEIALNLTYQSYEYIRYGIVVCSVPACVTIIPCSAFVSFVTHSKLCESSGPNARNYIEIKKRIPSIFKDESTGSCLCLRSLIYMSHVNKVQPIRLKMIRIAAIRRASLWEAWFFIESLLSPV
jgi:hypothetical protein